MTTRASTSQENTGTEALIFKDDPQFWYEIERLFGAAEYGGALFGEGIAIAKQIKSGDYDSWYHAMSPTDDRRPTPPLCGGRRAVEEGPQDQRARQFLARQQLLP